MSFHHKAQTSRCAPFFQTITSASLKWSHWHACKVSSLRRGLCVHGGGAGLWCFWYLDAFSISVCSGWLSRTVEEDTWLCWGYKVKKVNKVKHICGVQKRRTNAKWMNERDSGPRVAALNWAGKCCVGVCLGWMRVAFLIRRLHTMAERKVASPLEREQRAGSQGSPGICSINRAERIWGCLLKTPQQKSTELIEIACCLLWAVGLDPNTLK